MDRSTVGACVKSPSVHVLLATFNGGRFLPRFLQSLLQQSRTIDELIVSDDGSSDDTMEILRAFDVASCNAVEVDVSILPHATSHMGPRDNFAHLLSVAQGEYLLLADQDDYWHTDKVKRLLELAQRVEKKNQPLLIYSDATIINGMDYQLADSAATYQGFCINSGLDFKRCLVQNTVPGCTMLINRNLAERALPIPEVAIMHDWWLLLVAHVLGTVHCLPQSLLDYRLHEGNTLGAKPWGLKEIVNKVADGPDLIRKRVAQSWDGSLRQAQALCERFSEEMSPDKRALLENLLTLPNKGILRRRLAAARLGIRKEGLLRTAAFYLSL